MGVVAEMADRVVIMQHGRIVEQGTSLDVFGHPHEFYTRQLLAAVPRLGALAGTDGPPRVLKTDLPPKPKAAAPVLSVIDLSVTYGSASGLLFKPRAHFGFAAYLFGRRGVLTRTALDFLHYFNPRYRPWDVDSLPLIRAWQARVE